MTLQLIPSSWNCTTIGCGADPVRPHFVWTTLSRLGLTFSGSLRALSAASLHLRQGLRLGLRSSFLGGLSGDPGSPDLRPACPLFVAPRPLRDFDKDLFDEDKSILARLPMLLPLVACGVSAVSFPPPWIPTPTVLSVTHIVNKYQRSIPLRNDVL